MAGGPGSHKGRIIDDMVTSYGFKFISGERIVFERFAQHLGKTCEIESANDLKYLVNVSTVLSLYLL